MDINQLSELNQVARAQFDRDALNLREAMAKEAALRAELEALVSSEGKRVVAQQGGLEVAFAQTGEALWQHWADMRRRELLAKLAHQLAEKDVLRARARRSFGRHTALTSLENESRAERLDQAGKRDLQDLLDLEICREWGTGSMAPKP
ncbi:hypothetical protein Q4577_07010 [Marinovum sp. 2_MG-2023]|uniref:hypothetical protein n=1 Tax=unclassified Marinovum TaxID=2647166 RepID=UPI0026E25693|nr:MULTISPECIES: hypothetical protein [unclassified Marinovum]MDO6729761.1 hypothetical protein [Marinovum sp. 2_MG-2023]MDO6779575.1 hypothetical protein [Marinovum sp. 1_MG-2023]